MNRLKLLLVVCVIPIVFTACQPAANTAVNAPANANANSNANAAKSTAAAPTKESLMASEKGAYEAWKSKDAKYWETFLANNFVGFSANGKLDRAAAVKEYTGGDCDVKSYSFSDEQMTPLSTDAALVTHKTNYDGTCGGQKLPATVWTASIYTRDGDKWKGLFHGESPMSDPNSKPAALRPTRPRHPQQTNRRRTLQLLLRAKRNLMLVPTQC